VHLHHEGGRGEGAEWLAGLEPHVADRVQELLDDPEGWNLVHPDRFFEETVRQIEARDPRERLASIERELGTADDARQQLLLQEMRALRSEIVLHIDPNRQSGRGARAERDTP
jgi:hypothetical protein